MRAIHGTLSLQLIRLLARSADRVMLRRLVSLVKEAFYVISVPMVDRPELEEWLHPEGRFIVIGEAAHPVPVSTPVPLP